MAMELVTGQVVWLAFATPASSIDGGKQIATVHRAVVIDGADRIVKRDSGYVSVCHLWSCEQPHSTEAAAWAANADLLERFVVAVEEKAKECRLAAAQAAAQAEIVAIGGASV